MSSSARFRLSLMMFFQYFVHGATMPILSHYLKNYLGFEPWQGGVVLAMLALGALFAPWLTAWFADRRVGAERFLALCHFLAGGMMALVSRQTQFVPFVSLYFLYALVFMPSMGLTNAIVFSHVNNAKREYGGIRLWGTGGWIAVAWLFGFFWLKGGGEALLNDRLPHALRLSAAASICFGFYALTLPRPGGAHETRDIHFTPWKAFRVFARPSLAVLCVVSLLTSCLHQCYYYGMSPFLSQSGVPGRYIMPAMSLGQFSEIFFMGIVGFCLARFKLKHILIVGILAQSLRFSAFAVGHPIGLTLSAIPLHGVCYAFFFTAATIYVDTHSSPESRASAQQFYALIVAGVGPFAGYLFGGQMGQFFRDPTSGDIQFRAFWSLAAGLAVLVALVLALFFREEEPAAELTQEAS